MSNNIYVRGTSDEQRRMLLFRILYDCARKLNPVRIERDPSVRSMQKPTEKHCLTSDSNHIDDEEGQGPRE